MNQSTMINLKELVLASKNERVALRSSFQNEVEKRMENDISNFIKRHKIEALVKKSALRGEHTITIPIRRPFKGWHHPTDFFVERKSTDDNLHVGLNYNQFVNQVKQHLEQEDSVSCQIQFEHEPKSGQLRMVAIELDWESMVPVSVMIDFHYGGFIEIDDFVENETFAQLIVRKALSPRDGTRVFIQDAGKNLNRIKVSRYHGKSVSLIVEQLQNEESFDLNA
tara:strand:+ start:5675 stop:6346 length:672 start_codon:yes stop_codon:yes gene_type:complete